MEELLIYLLKSSGLIAVFYLTYYFLMRKETFFNSNRWFLLCGLFTSVFLPLFYIKKIVLIDRPKIITQHLLTYSQQPTTGIQNCPVVEAFDWIQFIWISYTFIACIFMIRMLLNLTSLFRMLYKQQVAMKEGFKLINVNQDLTPFSFFNYIVYNKNLYSNEELENILLHEKIHCKEKHSIDILIAELLSVLFWFNPFIWFLISGGI